MNTTIKLTFETGDRPADEVEQEVQEAVKAATGETPRTHQYAGNVVWNPSSVPEIEYVHNVDVPRAVQTRYNDTVDAGDGKLYERMDGEFVVVDQIYSEETDFGEYVLDYFRINYGIAPWYRYSKPTDSGELSRPAERKSWLSILSPSAFEVPDLDEETAVSWLTADDRAVRKRAIRYLAFEGIGDPRKYEQFLEAVQTVDERTRALVASELWTPAPLGSKSAIDASLVESLLALVDDPVPEVRIGAFMGASRAIDALYDRTATEDAETDPVDTVVKSFYEAWERLLDDPDPRIRERTVRCLSELLGSEGMHILSDGLWLRIDFPLRWRIVRAIEENIHDDSLGTLDCPTPITPMAFRDEHSAVPTLVDYAYDVQGPSCRAVRSMLADFAMDEPKATLDALDPALDAVEGDEPLVADIRLLAALAEEWPGRVATVAADLVGILENPSDPDDDEDDQESFFETDYVDQTDPEKKQRAVAQALSNLPDESHSVDSSTLAAVTAGITKDSYSGPELVPDRVAALTDVDPETAVDKLRTLPEQIKDDRDDDGFFRSNVDSAIYQAGKVNVEVIARALPDLIALFDEPPEISEELAEAIARTAVEHPEDVAEHVDAIIPCLGHCKPIVREAVATALVAVGREYPAALSDPYSALVERASDAIDIETLETERKRTDRSPGTPADWPLGTLASDPSAIIDVVTDSLAEDFYRHERLANLIREIRAGDTAAAEHLLTTLLERRRSQIVASTSQKEVLKRLAETDPGLLVGIAETLVEILANPEFETRANPDCDSSRASQGAKSLETALLAVAQSDPTATLAAIESQYPSVEDFLADHETKRRREIVSHVVEEELTL